MSDNQKALILLLLFGSGAGGAAFNVETITQLLQSFHIQFNNITGPILDQIMPIIRKLKNN